MAPNPHKTHSQKRAVSQSSFKPPLRLSKSRGTTPDRPLGISEGSRDELAGTKSTHSQRKRTYDEEFTDEGETQDESPSTSPAAVDTNAYSRMSPLLILLKTRKQPRIESSQKSTTQKHDSQKHDLQKGTSQKPVSKGDSSQRHVSQNPAAKGKNKTSQSASAEAGMSKPSPTKPISQQPANVSKAQPQAPVVTKPSAIKPQGQRGGKGNKGSDANGNHSVSAEFRSRSNSSTTLAPGSNENSQSAPQRRVGFHSNHGDAGNKGSSARPTKPSESSKQTSVQSDQIILSKSEEQAFVELNLRTRRYFMTYLSNTFVDEPVRDIFPGMRPTHAVYKMARYKVQRSYKTWKGEVLKQALTWVQRWISTQRPDRAEHLLGLRSFSEIKREIRSEYEPAWPESIFRFALEAVNFSEISPLAHKFLQCEFIVPTGAFHSC